MKGCPAQPFFSPPPPRSPSQLMCYALSFAFMRLEAAGAFVGVFSSYFVMVPFVVSIATGGTSNRIVRIVFAFVPIWSARANMPPSSPSPLSTMLQSGGTGTREGKHTTRHAVRAIGREGGGRGRTGTTKT